MAASVQPLAPASLVRRQIQQLQSSAASGRLPPHLAGAPLRLVRARTNLEAVWRSLERAERGENRAPTPAAAPWMSPATTASPAASSAATLSRRCPGDEEARSRGLAGLAPLVSRSTTHLPRLGDPNKEGGAAAALALPPRQPLRVIQRPAEGRDGAPRTPRDRQDAVYHTIEDKPGRAEPPHYDKPVSPPVPVDPGKRKRKADRQAEGRRPSRAPVAGGGSVRGASAAAQVPAKPDPLSPKPLLPRSASGHRTLPHKLAGLSVVEIKVETEAVARGQEADSDAKTNPSSTLPLKKGARGGQLWRRFSSFNPCSRWDDWNSSKKGNVKRPASNGKISQHDQRPPVPNRPLPPTPRPPAEKPANEPNKGLLVANLEHQPWFHNVDRKQAEELIKNGIDGYFLIRPSSQSQNPLTLTLWFNQRVYNISIRQRKDGRIALGFDKPDEQSFSSIEEMVMNYQSENLLLFSRNERTGRTVLTKSPPKHTH